MELRHLRYFIAVAEEGSVTRAATRLWIAQPGLSQQIRALERELGVQLFERRGRGVELTDEGKTFLDRARDVVRAADDALTLTQGAGQGLTGNLRLGLSWRSRYDVAPELLRTFNLARPGVEVSVMEAQTDALVRDLRDRRLDAAIVLGPQDHLPGVTALTISQRPIVVLLSRTHPLAAHDELHAADLQDQRFVVSGDWGAATYDQGVRRVLTALGVEHEALRGGYGLSMLEPVRDGSALMLDTIPSMPLGDEIVARALEPVSHIRFQLAWLTDTRTGPLEAFVELSRHEALVPDLRAGPKTG
jgi:DNA-binding transcriptional LysR family regulator